MKSDIKLDLLKSAMHTGEIAIFGGMALAAVYMFKDDADVGAALKDAALNIIPVAVAAFATKFNRTSATTPSSDYVNDIK